MNATPMNLNPANAAQTQSTVGRQQDSAAPDVPFSQVLSSEIAQNRKGSEAKEDADAQGSVEVASRPDALADAGAALAPKAAEAEEPTRDPLDALLTDGAATAPDALLALAIHPDMLKPAPASMDSLPPAEDAQTAQPTALGASAPPSPGARRDVPVAVQAGHAAEQAAGAQKNASTLAAKADFQAATAQATLSARPTAASAAAFSEQLAAHQSDAARAAETLTDPLSNPLARLAPPAPLVAPAAFEGPAASRLTPSVGTAAWGQALGEKIVWMAAGALQTASLTLNPPDLGPLQIVLNVSNDQATASFFSTQPEVRQALESAFPRLREMMSEAGIQLGQATVSADTPRQSDTPDRQAQRTVPAFFGAGEQDPAGLQAIHAPVQQSGRGLIDTFA